MIVVGYSPIGPQIGVSSALAALSAWNYFELERQTLVIQTGFYGNLEETLLGMRKWKQTEYWKTKGIDEVIRNEAANIQEEEVIERAIVTICAGRKSFELLPSTRKIDKERYEQSLLKYFVGFLQCYKERYDDIYIDLAWEQQSLLEQLYEVVDEILYFFPQNRWVLEHWNQKNGMRPKEKCILCKYEKDSFWNSSNTKLMYPNIGKNLIGVIPFSYSYMDSWSKGKAFPYLAIEHDQKKGEKSLFWKQVEQLGKQVNTEYEKGEGSVERRRK